MDSDRWRQIDNLLQSTLARPPGDRDRFLRQACAGDAELEREVRALITSNQAGVLADTGPELRRQVEKPLSAGDSTVTQLGSGNQVGWAGQTVSHYRIQEMLGAGGMGVVYKAFDTKLDRLVALKFLPPHVRHDHEVKRRLTEEARLASALDHPNIVVIHDIDETPGGDLFIAMAFHEGSTLRDRIGTGLPVPEALQIARQIASGLARAHEANVLHRDIKPGNIIVARDGITRIIDFGLAKSTDTTATVDGAAKGTPIYMSPEQASGKPVDCRTDLWSLGAVLFEMLTGSPPFRGDSQLSVMRAIVHDEPPKLLDVRPGIPPKVNAIVVRALEKDPARRYQSAAEMVRDVSAALASLDAPARRPSGLRSAYAIAALVLILLIAGGAVWFYQRSERRHWAREQAIPEIARLTGENKSVAAFLLMRKAGQYLPGDPQLAQIADGLTHLASVRSSPPGAMVEIKDYLSPGDPWFPLGTTPLENIKIPNGYLRWRISKTGMEEYLGAPVTGNIHGPIREFNFPLGLAASSPQGMVPVPVTKFYGYNWAFGDLGPYDLPAFYIDRFEVTNQQFQDFVDMGGYQKREYWKQKFVRDGRELSWVQAMDLMRDSSGRPGPSTWEAGHYPAGQANFPVGGVSWYEAAAYAEFAGKSLPAIAQWYLAAPSDVGRYVLQHSNFSGSALQPAGKQDGVGPWGTYDMAGNMGEWAWNEAGGNLHYLFGGAWNTPTYEYAGPAVVPPFDRSANCGFRCVRNSAALPAEVTAPKSLLVRDLSKAKPASDEAFSIYKAMYAYDRTPLNAKPEPVEQDSTDWHKEKITFDAAYGKERVIAYLFVPANVRPPYQAVVFFPSARVLDLTSSNKLGDMNCIDYVIKSGRAVLYPIYKGTYERPGPDSIGTTAAGREALIQQYKDLGRSIDYLETRTDVDRNKIGYLGASMGAAEGVIFAAMEDRLKTMVFLDAGFFSEKMLPGTDQVDFTPRMKKPVLMISGKYDWVFTGSDQMARMLGTAAADKRIVTFETGHDVTEQRADLVREVVAWLDKYLGRVN